MEPLQFFLESPSVSHVDASVKAQIKQHVGKGLCSAYRQALIDILSFWEKSRMSLRRINKGRLGSDQTSDRTDELANVYHQHWLDVCALGHILKELEITDLTEYVELRDLIISKKEAHETVSP